MRFLSSKYLSELRRGRRCRSCQRNPDHYSQIGEAAVGTRGKLGEETRSQICGNFKVIETYAIFVHIRKLLQCQSVYTVSSDC